MNKVFINRLLAMSLLIIYFTGVLLIVLPDSVITISIHLFVSFMISVLALIHFWNNRLNLFNGLNKDPDMKFFISTNTMVPIMISLLILIMGICEIPPVSACYDLFEYLKRSW